ncbi:MAG: hypothetical protein ABI363_01945 [Nitrosospira sp.]
MSENVNMPENMDMPDDVAIERRYAAIRTALLLLAFSLVIPVARYLLEP